MGQPGLNDFRADLRFSIEASDEPFWDAVYRKAFPNMLSHMATVGKSQAQLLGIDRVIILASGKTLYIDEKKRREVYTDVLLEFISVDTSGAPGWIEKDLQIDYLAYAFMPSKRVYLFPWEMLRRAWRQWGDKWKREHQIVKAQNNGYKTHSVAVPIEKLRAAVSTACIIQLD